MMCTVTMATDMLSITLSKILYYDKRSILLCSYYCVHKYNIYNWCSDFTLTLPYIDPSWASINLGVLLCIECSGIHRSLGVHISKVRSVTLDAWESEVLRVMTKLGNRIANSILEYDIPEGMVKPVANSTRYNHWNYCIL